MVEYGFFAHYTGASSHYPAGSAPWGRMWTEGYVYNALMGENITVGYESAARYFEL